MICGRASLRMCFGRGAGEVLAVEHDPPAARHGLAGEAIKKSRLAGAVRANEPDDVALIDGQIGAGDGAEFAELFRHIGRVQEFTGVRHGGASVKCRAD